MSLEAQIEAYAAWTEHLKQTLVVRAKFAAAGLSVPASPMSEFACDEFACEVIADPPSILGPLFPAKKVESKKVDAVLNGAGAVGGKKTTGRQGAGAPRRPRCVTCGGGLKGGRVPADLTCKRCRESKAPAKKEKRAETVTPLTPRAGTPVGPLPEGEGKQRCERCFVEVEPGKKLCRKCVDKLVDG